MDETASPEGTPRCRPGGRSARIQRAVMDATMQALIESGMEQLSVATIASQAGVHESTIYRRWGSREGLVIATVLARMSETIPLPDTGSFRTDLRAFLQSSADFLQSPPGLLLTRSAFATQSQGDAQSRQSYWLARFEQTGALVRRAHQRGELSPQIKPDVVITALMGALYVRLLFLQQPLDAPFLDQLTDMLLDGLLG